MTETLNEKALRAAYDLPWALEELTRNGQRCANIVSSDGTIVCEIQGILDSCGNRENGELIVSAVNGLGARSSLPAGDYAGLVERLGKLAKWADESQHEKWCGRKEVPVHGYSGEGKLIREAATAITTLVAENERFKRAHERHLILGAEVRARAEAAEAQVKAMEAREPRREWYWPADDTSSDACADSPRDATDPYPGEIAEYSCGGIAYTAFYGWLPAAEDADSDDDFEVDEPTLELAEGKMQAEIARRARAVKGGEHG